MCSYKKLKQDLFEKEFLRSSVANLQVDREIHFNPEFPSEDSI